MLRAGERFEDPGTGASLEVLEDRQGGTGSLELRRVIKPRTSPARAHVHLDYVERFMIEAGRAKAKLNGRALELVAGDAVEVPIGHRHVNPYNPGDEDLVERQIFEPASDFALAYFETLGHFMRAARTDRRGELPVLAAFAVAHATRSRTYAVGPPPALQRGVLFPLGARLARLRGYEVRLPH